ncbi:MAG: hypothetical protein RLN75_08080, partial [Longimicrobiales bacterium]
MPVTLNEADDRLGELCRKAESACVAVPSSHAWPVLLLDDFRKLPQVKLKTQERTPAAFVPSTQTIYVNEAPFFAMSE